MKDILILYARKQLRTFRVNYIRSRHYRNVDPVHDYRVALKRIDAIIKFLKKVHPDRNLRSIYKIASLQDFFKQGGELREAHVNQKIYRLMEKKSGFHFPLFRQFLWESRVRAYEKFLGSFRKYIPRKIIRFNDALCQTIYDLPAQSLASKVDEFIETRIARTEGLIMDHHVESKLHKIRKYIKSIKYMLEMMNIQERSYGKLNFTVEKITLLEDRIGDWHDLFVFKEDLDRFINRLKLSSSNYGSDQSPARVSIVDKKYRKTFEETVEYIYHEFKLEKPVQNISS